MGNVPKTYGEALIRIVDLEMEVKKRDETIVALKTTITKFEEALSRVEKHIDTMIERVERNAVSAVAANAVYASRSF